MKQKPSLTWILAIILCNTPYLAMAQTSYGKNQKISRSQRNKDYATHQLWADLGFVSLTSSLVAAGSGATYLATDYVLKKLNPQQSGNDQVDQSQQALAQILSPLGAFIGLGSLFKEISDKPSRRLVRFLTAKFYPKSIQPAEVRENTEFTEQLKSLEKLRKDPSKSVQFWDSKLFDSVTNMIQDHKLFTHNDTNILIYEKIAKNLARKLDDVFTIPYSSKEISPQQQEKVEDVIANYPEETKESIRGWVDEITLASQNNNIKEIRVTPVLFVGEPGTGKTYLMERIAKALELPFFAPDLSKYTDMTTLFGSHSWSDHYKPGLALETLKKGQGTQNVVLFLDEIDKIVNDSKGNQTNYSSNTGALKSYLLKFLEPGTTSIESDALDAPLDIRNIIIVMSSNADFSEEALNQRVNRIQMTGFDLDKREKIALAQLKKMGVEMTHLIREKVKDLCQHDTLEGVRTLVQVINRYAVFLRTTKNNPNRKFDLIKEYNNLRKRFTKATTESSKDSKSST